MVTIQIKAQHSLSRLNLRLLLAHAAALRTAGFLLIICGVISGVAQPTTKNVLILHSFSERSVTTPEDLLESPLRSRVSWPVNFYVEYLESRQFANPGYEKATVENLQNTYGTHQKLDLLLAESYPALQFAVTHRDELFPGAPIVFFGVDTRRLDGRKMWPGVTGVTETVDVQATINLALHLHPNTNTVAIVTNRSEYEDFWLSVVHNVLLRDYSALKEVDLVALPTSQLLDRVAALSPHTIVLFQRSPIASIQPAIGDYDILALIGKKLPTYCIWPVICLDHGGIGGAQADGHEELLLAAGIAIQVLSGERPENIPVTHTPSDKIFVDWRQLSQWHIPESALPAGSVVLYRPPSPWESYRKYVIATISVIVALLLLIIGLLWQRARKRKTEALLRESEKRFRVMADTTPSLVWMCDPWGKIIYLNERRLTFTGPDPDAGYGDSWMEYVHPDDRRNVQDVFSQALKERQAFSNEYRMRRNDGAYRWMLDVASPRLNGDGSFAGFIGSAIDVTDQKMAQQALEKVSGQLIEAQEKERGRIARDLHDDICQRLALLSMELDQANRSASASDDAMKKRLREIRQHCSEIAGDVQSLSHELHSSSLDYLGVAAAIRGFCLEFSAKHEVRIEFTDRDVPADLSREISLSLFRIAQEALHNAVKYSGVSQYTVELTATADEIQLIVSDAGRGFDVRAAELKRGLGLVSMQERVHLIHGSLIVESVPGEGTRILAVVPLVGEIDRSSDVRDAEEPERALGAV